MSGVEIPVRVVEIEQATPTVRRFRLAPTDGTVLPPFAAGAHVVVLMPAQDRTIRNAYSLVDRSEDGSSYRIGVLRVQESRGGSRFMHERVEIGSELRITMPVNLFPLFLPGRRHLLVAGGIGITPIHAMAGSSGGSAPTTRSTTPCGTRRTAPSSPNCARPTATGSGCTATIARRSWR